MWQSWRMAKQTRRAAWATSERWTERQAREALGALDASGESVAAFAARAGVSAWRLYHWRARLSEQPAAFVEVQPDAEPRGGGCVFEVVLRGGRVVRVPSEFDGGVLRRLVAVLEGDAC